jgi:hypothetical protein
VKNRYLLSCGVIALLAGILHLAIIAGGPAWYAFFGAPTRIVRMAGEGALYPVIFCLVAAALLFLCACYAFSGAGVFRRLPFLRTGLFLVGSGFILRGTLLIPLMALRPDVAGRVCNSNGIDTFVILTSAIALATGIGYVLGARKV